MANVLPAVSGSTLPNVEGRRIDRFSVVVFSLGLLEALLGKPGTLHSLGQIVISALGVPPDLRGAPVPGRLLVGPRQGWGVGCILADPVGRVCLKLPGRGWSPAQEWWVTLLRLVCLASFPPYFTRPRRGLLWCFVTVALLSGGGAGDLFGVALYPTVGHCAKSSTPNSQCGIGLTSYSLFGLVPSPCLHLLFLYAARLSSWYAFF